MVSGKSYYKSYSSCVLYHSSFSSVDMDIVVVKIGSFVTSILATFSVPFGLLRDMLYGFVLSQIALSVGCTTNSSLTIVVSQT